MAATMTMGRIEGQVRRNHLFDVYPDAYRWKPQTVLVFIYDAIDELCMILNPWAQYNQETGNLLNPYNVPTAKTLSIMEEGATLDAAVTDVRALVIPVDDRFEQAIIHLAASKCFLIDNSDTANALKAADLYEKAKGYAQS